MDGRRGCYKSRVEPSKPGRVRCLRCQKAFSSPDRACIRICPKCKKDPERLGRIAENASEAHGIQVPDAEDDRT